MTAAATPLLHYEVHGERGPYLLLVHGFLSSRAQWLPNIDALTAFARPVVIELLGHGRSPSPDDPALYTPEHYVTAFERILEALGAERWLVCGQSLGAALTLRYVLERPERVIAHAFTNSMSALAEEGWTARVLPAMQAQAERLRADGRAAIDAHPLNPARGARLAADVASAFRADVAMHDPEGLALTGLHTIPGSSVRGRIAENRVPSLLLAGEREQRFERYRRFAEEAMPQLQTVVLNAGHAVNIDSAPQFNEAVREFFEAHIARG